MSDTQIAPSGELNEEVARHAAAEWLRKFEAALAAGSAEQLTGLFTEAATWRDFMAFSWDVSNRIGRDELITRLLDWNGAAGAGEFALTPEQDPVIAEGNIQAFFDFTTAERIDRGYAYLVPGGDGWVAATLETQADALQRFPESTGHNRPQGKTHGVVQNRTRWTNDRAEEIAFEHSEPAAVVLGAGHNGLSIAARLSALDVPTLVIDREPRVGDVWRKRYASLALHSILHVDHLPYMPFPKTWTAHTPKDKLADFLEYYSHALDLNVWTGTTFLDASYDADASVWTIRVERPDGQVRELHPRQFVVAAGLNGTPKIPDVPGLDKFEGEYAHSGAYQDAADQAGKKVLVVGAGVSAHEMAHDLYEHGAEVTMMQRGATYVINFDTFNKFWFGLYTEDQDLPIEFADQVAYSMPNLIGDEINKQLVELAKEEDKELLEALEARGFKLEWGPEGTGIIGAHMAGRDSYQINIGASELIADGRVELKSGVELAEVKEHSAVFTDGSEIDVDLILFATGYEQLWDHIQPTLGGAAAEITKVYGRAEDGEYANVWRRSAQPGLWFGTGFVGMARFHSKFMTLLIKAIEEGIAPVDPDR
ncbi:MAG: NAD(P)/FAD-dependent oxidoreductase [Solirubrobacterales bacterium]